MTSYLKPLLLFFCLGSLGGCSDIPSGPETVRVTGTVHYQGSPIEGANVLFQPVEGSGQTLASQSATNAEGQFELSTHVGGGQFKPGIEPGKYSVTITKLDPASTTMLAPPRNLLPKKYASPQTSGLSADVVTDKENDFKFTLTD